MTKQEMMAAESRRRMEEKAARVQEMMERNKEEKHREIEEQRRKAEMRIKEVVDKNKKIQLDKRTAYEIKQDEIALAKKEKEVELKLLTEKQVRL